MSRRKWMKFKENKELNAPAPNWTTKKEEQQQTEQDLKKAQDQLDKRQPERFKSQKSASKKMKQMAQNMENDMAASEKEQIELDMKAVRQLLENIITYPLIRKT